MPVENKTEQHATKLIDEFLSKIPSLANKILKRQITVREILDGEILGGNLVPETDSFGVYLFVDEGIVVYIGRALGSCFGVRVWSRLKSLNNPEWVRVVKKKTTNVIVVVMPDQENYWAASLEAFLISKMWPKFNLRIS